MALPSESRASMLSCISTLPSFGAALVRAFTISALKDMPGCSLGLGDEVGVDEGGGSVTLGESAAIAGLGAGVSAGTFGGVDAKGGTASGDLDEGGGSPSLLGSDLLDSPGGVAAAGMDAVSSPGLARSASFESPGFRASADLACCCGSSGLLGSSGKVVERREVSVDGDCGVLPVGMGDGESPIFDPSGRPAVEPAGMDAVDSPFFESPDDPGMAALGSDSAGRVLAEARLTAGELVRSFPRLVPLDESALPSSGSNTTICVGVEVPGSSLPMADSGC